LASFPCPPLPEGEGWGEGVGLEKYSFYTLILSFSQREKGLFVLNIFHDFATTLV